MGFLGMGEIQGADFTVQLPKNVFTMGEKVTVKVIADNTSVKKGLEKIKLKLR